MKTAFFALAILALLPTAARAGAPADLNPRPQAHGKMITLADLFDGVEGPAAGVVVAPAPPPGGETVLDAGRVQLIAHGAGVDWANRTGQRRILVWAADEETAAPVAAQKPAVKAAKTAKTAHGRAAPPPVREPQILVYARNLATGDLVSASDLVWSDAGALPVALDAPSDPAQAIGKVLRRPVRAGASVNGADLAQARVIRRDDLVSVDYQTDGVSLTLEGKALSDACVGDTLQVLNPQSKKIIEAVASGPDRAVVGPAAEALKATAFNRPHSYAVR